MNFRQCYNFGFIWYILFFSSRVIGQQQDYYDYAQQDEDNLYHDYAIRAQQKNAAAGNAGGGINWLQVFMGAGAGWIIGSKYHCKRLTKKLYGKNKKDQKELYSKYYNDVYRLETQNAEMKSALEKLGVKVK